MRLIKLLPFIIRHIRKLTELSTFLCDGVFVKEMNKKEYCIIYYFPFSSLRFVIRKKEFKKEKDDFRENESSLMMYDVKELNELY